MDERIEARQLMDALLPEWLERLREATGVPVALGGTTRHNVKGLCLVLDCLLGTVGDSLRGLVVQSGKGLGGCVLRRRAPLRVNDYLTTMAITHEYDRVVRDERLTSVFAVPVLIRGEVGSVLYGAVRGRSPLGERALRTAAVVADQLRRDVEDRLSFTPGAGSPQTRGALAELAAVIRDTGDPALRARLVRIQQVLSGQSARGEVKPLLSPRETDVLRLVEVGAGNVEIADRLGLSLETVKTYLRSAMRKLEARNRTAAAHRARLNGQL
ncbi:LuxR C-terminal-related transcriptional regulator [Streptomyces sp. NBC_00510]